MAEASSDAGTLRPRLQSTLDSIPSSFKVKVSEFNPLPIVVSILALEEDGQDVVINLDESASPSAASAANDEETVAPSKRSAASIKKAAAAKSYTTTGPPKTQAEGAKQLIAQYRLIDKAAGEAVSCYAEGFNRSISNYTDILRHIGGAQSSAQKLARDLTVVRRYLGKESDTAAGGDEDMAVVTPAERRRVVEALWKQYLESEAMVDIYRRIDRILLAPETVLDRISKRYYLHAARLVSRSIDDLRSEDLREIPALDPLLHLLFQQREALRTEILREIIDFVYDPRHAAAAATGESRLQRQNRPALTDGADSDSASEESAISDNDSDEDDMDENTSDSAADGDETDKGSRSNAARIARILDLENLNAKVRPRSKNFMRILIESVRLLEQVPLGVIVAELLSQVRPRVQRMCVDLHKVTATVLARDPSNHAFARFSPPGGAGSDLAQIISSAELQRQQAALGQLFSVFLDRCAAILAQHQLIVRIFTRREGVVETAGDDALTCLFSVWSVMQHELVRLICAHVDFNEAQAVRQPRKGEAGVDVLTPIGGGGQSMNNGSEDTGRSRAAKLFSFAGSSAATFYSSDKTDTLSSHPTGGFNFISATPYNVTCLFAQIQKFDEKVRDLLSQTLQFDPKSSQSSRDLRTPQTTRVDRLDVNVCVTLSGFVDSVVVKSFLPRLKSDMRKRVQAAVSHLDAWGSTAAVSLGADDIGARLRTRLNVVTEIWMMLHELVQLHTHLEANHTAYFLSLMTSTCERFASDLRSEIFGKLLKNTVSAERLSAVAYFKILQQDPLFSQARVDLCGETEEGRTQHLADADFESQNDSFMQQEAAFEKENAWFAVNKHIFKEQLVGGQGSSDDSTSATNTLSSISMLASIATSVGWLATEVERLRSVVLKTREIYRPQVVEEEQVVDPSKPVLNVLRVAEKQVKKALVQTLDTTLNTLEQLDPDKEKIHQESKSIRRETKHATDLIRVAEKLRNLSEHAMIALRVEVRVRSQYFLDGVRDARYVLDPGAEEGSLVRVQAAPLPDPFVVELNSELASISEATAVHLTSRQRRYIWEGVPSMIATLLSVHALNLMPRRDAVDALGAAKMIRNVGALQQQLTHINPRWFKAGPFERVRRFYTLLGQSPTPDALLSQISQHVSTAGSGALSLEEYRALLEYKHPDGKISERDARLLRELHQKRNLYAQALAPEQPPTKTEVSTP